MQSQSSFRAIALTTIFALSTTFGLTSPTPRLDAADDPPALPPVDAPPADVARAMQDKNYDAAIAAIDKHVAANAEAADYMMYLKARALFHQEQYDAAGVAFDEVVNQFPQGKWRRRAEFGKGVALARKGDFIAAETIYRAQAEALLATERKQELAAIILEFADAFFEPASARAKPDYDRARRFYAKALEIGPAPPQRAAIEIRIGQCFENLENWADAANAYAAFVKKYGEEKPGAPADVSPVDRAKIVAMRIDAAYRNGWCQFKQGSLHDARRTWRDLLASQIAAEPPDDASRERLAEAMFHMPETYGAPNPPTTEDLDMALAACDAFLARFPHHALAGATHLRAVQCLMNHGRYNAASDRIAAYLADERHADREETPRMRIALGVCFARQKEFTKAIETWREYLSKYPAHDGWSDTQKAILDAEYAAAADAREQKEFARARESWTAFLAAHPLDPRAPRILRIFGDMQFEQEQWEEAIADWRRVVSKYPKTDEASHAQFEIASLLESKLGRLDEALEEYKKLDWGPYHERAVQRIARLVAKEMSISTDRVFRTDETPKITLKSRNIENVTVNVYMVDLETYFRKMHLASGVEGLDIALIDPDNTFEFTPPDFAKYKPTESSIEIPLPDIDGGAVMAVTVSGESLEATTLVIRSDLDIIVKSSRDEVLVFAQNMRTGEPAPGARVLLSNGAQVFAEAKTAGDGVYLATHDALKSASDVRAFAIIDGNIASNSVGLGGVEVQQGLADKGYIYTDRPAYRSGQMVHFRGVIRRVAGDRYVVDENKVFNIRILDPRGREIWTGEEMLNAFGALHGHFQLPGETPAGEYRVDVRELDKDGGKRNYQGTFVVQDYQLEPIHLTIDAPRRVYYRGEEIEGKIRAAYYHGAPLAEAVIRYQLAGEAWIEATTDANGEVKFILPTREYRETQPLPLVVQLPSRNLASQSVFILATRGFSIATDTPRDTYLAGESFETTVTTIDAEGKPIGTELEATLYQIGDARHAPNQQQVAALDAGGERLIDTKKLTTDPKTGAARVTFTAKNGGAYVIRFTGRDRFENPISTEEHVHISGDDDHVRLRILADKHTFKVGDDATVRVHWRDAPALALVTHQGAKILGHRLVELKQGENTLPIAMTSELAPNFDLAIAVMTDHRNADPDDASGASRAATRFHEASSPFTVIREMNLALDVAGSGDVRPGDDVEVTITATDPQGRPLEAELSLAMIEQSLLDRFGGAAATIDDYFRGARRASAFRTTSSIAFAYHPTTRPINTNLLAETERLETEAEEADALELVISSINRADESSEIRDRENAPADGIVDMFSDPFGDAANSGADAPSSESRPPASLPMQSRSSGERYGRDLARQQAGQPFAPGLGGGQLGKQSADGARYSFGVEFQDESGGAGSRRMFAESLDRDGRREENISGRGLVRTIPRDKSLAETFLRREQQASTLNGGAAVYFVEDGRWGYLNLATMDAKKIDAFAAELASSGAVLLPQSHSAETGYWNPSVITDASGKAKLTLTVPDRATAWRLTARGITHETLAGDAETTLVAKKPLFGELKLPLAFIDGDDARILATIHNDLLDAGTINVTLKTTIGTWSQSQTKAIEIKSKGPTEVVFPAKIDRSPSGHSDANDKTGEGESALSPDVEAQFELTIATGESRDVTRRAAPIRPYGMNVANTISGTANSDTTAWIELPDGMPVDDPSMQIVIGPNVTRSLLDIVLAPSACFVDSRTFDVAIDVATSDLMAALALAKMLGETRQAAGPDAQSLDARIRSSVGVLVSAQRDDGAWGWCAAESAPPNPFVTARVVWALALAKNAGYAVPDELLQKATAYLEAHTASLETSAHESRAVLTHALAVAGKGDFAQANRLYRGRNEMGSPALCYLALTFAELDRNETARELLAIVTSRGFGPEQKDVIAWNASPTELRALHALALFQSAPNAPDAAEQAEWLLAHRTGNRWAPDKATGPATMALAIHFAKRQFDSAAYELTVFVNDAEAAKLAITPSAIAKTMDIPASLLSFVGGKTRQTIRFQLLGRGEYTYQIAFGGFVPADKLTSTAKEWKVERHYEPAQLEMDGVIIPRGFGVVDGGYTQFRNPLTELPVGDRGVVELRVWRHGVSSRTPDDALSYLVVTEPIPSGAAVVENSITGPFERYEIGASEITFFIGARRGVGTIRYELHGYLPGSYRAGPTVARNAYARGQFVVGEPKSLRVLPLGAKSSDAYRLSPDELFHLGKRNFEHGDMPRAIEHLSKLLDDWRLHADPYKESVTMLLDAYVEVGPPREIVKHFEIVKEKWPELEIAFDKILKIGAAYHAMGEYERAYMVFRATVESSFLRDVRVAGFLDSEGEFLRSAAVMRDLLRQYPPEPYVASAEYALSQQIYAKADALAQDAALRAKFRERRLTRVDLVRQALGMLEAFLTNYPEDPAADEAAFSVANALLELKQYAAAIASSERYVERYADSRYVESYLFTIGFCHFALGEHEEALATCSKVAEMKRKDPATGRMVAAENRWQAVYILGQIYHSLGDAADAIREYTRVRDRFPDAAEAIEYFSRKEVNLPEVTTRRAGDEKPVMLEFRNIPTCDLRVYKIDLMKFSLLERNLKNITKINLAGIRPHHEATIELGDGKDYRDREHPLSIPLKEEGAYLVVCRGGDLYASGLVLVSPLVVDVQEDAESGRVRATVKDMSKNEEGTYVADVHVKVIGSQDDQFTSGETDLRGVFVADDIDGTSTVIARSEDGQYAFFRGDTHLGASPKAERGKEKSEQKSLPQRKSQSKSELLENVYGGRGAASRSNEVKLQELYQNDAKGVQVQQAK